MLNSYYKKCPRCGEKSPKTANKCSYCGLIFERLNWATNSAAKKMLRTKQKDKVVYIKGYPNDVKKSKVVLLCLFLGLFGAHYYLIGRLAKAVFMTVFGTLAVTFASLSVFDLVPTEIYITAQVISAIPFIIWLFDIVNVCINKIKIPVSIDLTEEKWKQ